MNNVRFFIIERFGLRVYKEEFNLFDSNITLMGFFPNYNKKKCEDFLLYLRSNPNSNIHEFFKNYNK